MTQKCCKLLLLLTVLTGCSESFEKGSDGLEYKVIRTDEPGPEAIRGQYLKLAVTQLYGDTVLRNVANSGYQYQLLDSAGMTIDSWNIFQGAHIGDSMVFRVNSDSAFKDNKPSFVKDEKWLITTVKVVGILPNADSARADMERNMPAAPGAGE